MAKHGKLELTWVGKDEQVRQVRLERRVLVDDPARSYGEALPGFYRICNEGRSDMLARWVSRPSCPGAFAGQKVQHGD